MTISLSSFPFLSDASYEILVYILFRSSSPSIPTGLPLCLTYYYQHFPACLSDHQFVLYICGTFYIFIYLQDSWLSANTPLLTYLSHQPYSWAIDDGQSWFHPTHYSALCDSQRGIYLICHSQAVTSLCTSTTMRAGIFTSHSQAIPP